MDVPEWPTHHHHQVHQGSGAEMALAGVKIDEAYHGEGLLCLLQAAIIGKTLQVPEGYHDGIQ